MIRRATLHLLLPLVVLAPLAARADKQENELMTKYFDFDDSNGARHYVAKGPLKVLLTDYDCNINIFKCAAPFKAVDGKVDADMKQLFLDLIQKDDKSDATKPPWLIECPDGRGPPYMNGMGLVGVGLVDDPRGAEALVKLASNDKVLASLSGANRLDLVRSMWWRGARADDATWAKVLRAKASINEFKAMALQSLARWGSDAAVEYCQGAFTEEHDTGLIRSCINYLGERKAKGAVPMLTRNFEKFPAETARALGLIGGDDAKGAVEAALAAAEKAPPEPRMPLLVAMLNLGVTKHWDEVALYLKGQRPAPAGQKPPKKPVVIPPQGDFIKWASLELTKMRNAKLNAQVDKALAAAAATKDPKEWKGWIYATIALAQRGEAKAAKALAAALNDPKDEVRNAALDGAGGRDDSPSGNFSYVGMGVVADEQLVPALLAYHVAESDKDKRTKAIIAIASVRAAVAAKGAKGAAN